MEEILHHLGCRKPCKESDIYHINWLAGFLPSTVLNNQDLLENNQGPRLKPSPYHQLSFSLSPGRLGYVKGMKYYPIYPVVLVIIS